MLPNNTHELAWAAGFFDGEGCTYRRKDGGLLLEISQKEYAPLERFKNIIRVGKVKDYRHKSDLSGYSKMIYKLTVSNFEHVQYVMAMLWKYLSPIKRQQYKLAVTAYILNCKKNNYSMTNSAIRSREFRKYGTKIRQLKTLIGPTVINPFKQEA